MYLSGEADELNKQKIDFLFKALYTQITIFQEISQNLKKNKNHLRDDLIVYKISKFQRLKVNSELVSRPE